jgi:glycosyltransferase involved in cell wall biosynthesis
MKECDLMFFTSVAEGTPHVILEAIGNNLPVICFNTCGHGDSVNNQVGVKIELSNPSRSVREFAFIINDLVKSRDKIKQLKENCSQRQVELSWERKAEEMVDYAEKSLF